MQLCRARLGLVDKTFEIVRSNELRQIKIKNSAYYIKEHCFMNSVLLNLIQIIIIF
jgi:hypothetical protein